MKNPIRRYVDESGLTTREFAMAIGVNVGLLYHYIRGIPANMSPQFAWKLSKIGIDPGKTMQEYAEWREEEARRIRRRISV